MKVGRLIEILETMDPEANVYLMVQRNWPFEMSLSGVAVREDFTEADPDDEIPIHESGERWAAPAASLPPGDVFLLDGEQLRYGNADAWDVARG